MIPAKRTLSILCALAATTMFGAIWTGIAQEQDVTEAPTGFNTPSFNGAASVSNGITEPSGDSLAQHAG
jgi:hypothetical protein